MLRVWIVALLALLAPSCGDSKEKAVSETTLGFALVEERKIPPPAEVVILPAFDPDAIGPTVVVKAPVQTGRVAQVSRTKDRTGYDAVGFTLTSEAEAMFKKFTAEHVDERMAIVLGGQVVVVATINEPLPGSGMISGRFSKAQADELYSRFR